jgi:hypothetical protein
MKLGTSKAILSDTETVNDPKVLRRHISLA